MKLKFSLKNKEAYLEADIEKLVEKGMDNKSQKPREENQIPDKTGRKKKNTLIKS